MEALEQALQAIEELETTLKGSSIEDPTSAAIKVLVLVYFLLPVYRLTF